MVWALNADSIVPGFAAEIIIEYLDELWIFELVSQSVIYGRAPD